MSDLESLALVVVAVSGLFLPVTITWWKGRPIVPIALLSLVFWRRVEGRTLDVHSAMWPTPSNP